MKTCKTFCRLAKATEDLQGLLKSCKSFCRLARLSERLSDLLKTCKIFCSTGMTRIKTVAGIKWKFVSGLKCLSRYSIINFKFHFNHSMSIIHVTIQNTKFSGILIESLESSRRNAKAFYLNHEVPRQNDVFWSSMYLV